MAGRWVHGSGDERKRLGQRSRVGETGTAGRGAPGDAAGRDLCKRRALDGGAVGGGWPEESVSSWWSSMASWLM